MLIQNTSSMAPAPQPARFTSDSAPNVVAATPSNAAQPSALPELPQTAAKQVAEQPLSTRQLKGVVDNINRALKEVGRNLEFSVDENTNKQVVKLVDGETGNVIRQFPSEEALAISHAIDNIQKGLLLKQKA